MTQARCAGAGYRSANKIQYIAYSIFIVEILDNLSKYAVNTGVGYGCSWAEDSLHYV